MSSLWRTIGGMAWCDPHTHTHARTHVTRCAQRIFITSFHFFFLAFFNRIIRWRIAGVRSIICCNCKMGKMKEKKGLFHCVHLMPIVLLVLTLYDRCTLSKQRTYRTTIQIHRESLLAGERITDTHSNRFFSVCFCLFVGCFIYEWQTGSCAEPFQKIACRIGVNDGVMG